MFTGLWFLFHGTASAHAQPLPAEKAPLAEAVLVEPGSSCLDHARVVGHVRMWLGVDAVDRGIQVRVHGDANNPRRLWFDLHRGRERSRRTFDPAPEGCDDVHAVVGLAIALAIDAERLRQTLLPPAPEPPKLALLALQVSVAYDVLPDDSLGLLAGAELEVLPWFSIRIDALGHYSWNDGIVGSRGHFDALLLGGSVQVCAGGRLDPNVRVALCSGAASGALHAWGTDYEPSSSDTGFWLAVRSGARVHAHVGLDWVLDLDVLSVVESPSFGAQKGTMDLTRQASSAGFMLSLGPVVAF